MRLESLVVSLELAKRLKELGVRQESLWWWRDGVGAQLRCNLYPAQMDTQDVYQSYAAFTVGELGEMLPSTLWEPYDIEQYVYANPRKYGIEANTYHDGVAKKHHSVIADKEADARGLMLEYLIKNKLMTV